MRTFFIRAQLPLLGLALSVAGILPAHAEQPRAYDCDQHSEAERAPIVVVTTPAAGSTLGSGSVTIQGAAFDCNADSGAGVDRVSVFVGKREAGGVPLGDAVLNLASPIPVQPADQYSHAGWSLTATVPASADATNGLVVYAHSETSGVEGTMSVPLASASQAPAVVSQSTQVPTNAASGSCDFITPFQPSLFSSSTRVDNQWLPLVPGTEFTFQGRANRGGGLLPHTVVFTVTDLTKTVAGVQTVVLWDRDIQDGELSEAELAFHAQDKTGNVWVLGEYPEEYDSGQFAGAPKTWITGQADAQGGLAIMGQPAVGTPAYLQGSVPSIEFLDCARVSAMDQSVCVPAGCFDHVLVTDETSPLASDAAHQQKFYAPNVGNIQITASNDPEGETLVLAKVNNLDAEGLAQARTEALKLEEHAYQVSDVYRATPPAMP